MNANCLKKLITSSFILLLLLSPSATWAQNSTDLEAEVERLRAENEALKSDNLEMRNWIIAEGGDPVTITNPPPIPAAVAMTNTGLSLVPVGFPAEVPAEWQFVADYQLLMMESIAFLCLDPEAPSFIRGQVGAGTLHAFNNPDSWGNDRADEFFRLQAEFDALLQAAIQAAQTEGIAVPSWVPLAPYSLTDTLVLLDGTYEGCSTGQSFVGGK